jgi:rubredoxin
MLVDGETKQIDAHGDCPECGSSWDAGPVFDALRKQPHYVGKTDDELRAHVTEAYGNANAHFSRLIGIEIRGYYDGVCKWKCPDCNKEWERFARR